MKRTQNRWDSGAYGKGEGISGLRYFEGDDLKYNDRMKYQADTQKEWIQEQKRENYLKQQRELEEQKQYDEETLAQNSMRGMLEDQNNDKRAAMMKAMQEENQRLALEKKMREEDDKGWQHEMDQAELVRDDE